MRGKILVVDDDPDVLRSVVRMLDADDYEVLEETSALRALEITKLHTPDLLLTDLSMPQMTGLDLLRAVRQLPVPLAVVVMSGTATIPNAVEAVQLGALDFLEKPIRAERLRMTLAQALGVARAREAEARAADELGQRIVGTSRVMVELGRTVAKVAQSDGRVLIRGENGTGKELVAAAVHAGSSRRHRPLVKLNCSAVPADLIESELFGHEKGSFTGAHTSRRGRFELADGGTLFLDEIGDTPLPMQAKLLRVLQEGQFERVGGCQTFQVDVRVLAATNRDIEAMIEQGTFREDLYYRLNVVVIDVPPLRERLEDVPLLVQRFLRETGGNVKPLEFTQGAIEALKAHSYPGNVRELRNLVERFSILSDSRVIDETQVRDLLQSTGSHRRLPVAGTRLYERGVSLHDLMEKVERRVLKEAILDHQGNKSAAAKALAVERSHFYKKCRALGV